MTVVFAKTLPGRARGALAALVLLFAVQAVPALHADMVTEVRVERVKPPREKLPTLRFLKENKDFIRARFDLLRERLVDRHVDGAPIDPRFLAYQRLLADVMAADDSAAVTAERRERMALLQSITELGALESQLDLLEQLLGDQRTRLAELQADFTGRQQTEMVVLVRGAPAAEVDEISLTISDGATLRVPITAQERASLAEGGVLQIFHGMVEPREQLIEVGIGGAAWTAGAPGFMTLEPARDHLTFLEIDLSPTAPGQGGAGVRATTWLHDAALPTAGG